MHVANSEARRESLIALQCAAMVLVLRITEWLCQI
jgi:hypothetical protein